MIMGSLSGSLILALHHSRTSTHNSIAIKRNAHSSIHANEHGKAIWFVIDHAADSSNINPAFDRGLIHKSRVIPHAVLNETQTEREHSRRKLLIRSLHTFTFRSVSAQCPCLAASRSASALVRHLIGSCCQQWVAERQPVNETGS